MPPWSDEPYHATMGERRNPGGRFSLLGRKGHRLPPTPRERTTGGAWASNVPRQGGCGVGAVGDELQERYGMQHARHGY